MPSLANLLSESAPRSYRIARISAAAKNGMNCFNNNVFVVFEYPSPDYFSFLELNKNRHCTYSNIRIMSLKHTKDPMSLIRYITYACI